MQRAMILGAGYGTRLRPLTDESPKPLVPVGDRPLLAHAAWGLQTQEPTELVVNTHYRPGDFSSIIESIGVKIHILHEPEILGTAGGIARAKHLLGTGPVVVMNGDILCRPPVERLRREASDGLTLVVEQAPAGRGPVGLGSDGAVVRLRGRTFGTEVRGAYYVGVAALGARCLATLPKRGCLVGDWALPELERGGRIGTFLLQGEWLDVGSLGAYLKANLNWLEELTTPSRGWFGPLAAPQGGSPEQSFLGPGASIAPQVALERSVVGAGARVEGAGRVVRCVIWPGAQVRAPLADAVVTASGRIVSCLESAADLG